MTKKVSRIIGIIMLLAAIGFLIFAFNNPQFSFPWVNVVTYILYAVYLVVAILLIASPIKTKD